MSGELLANHRIVTTRKPEVMEQWIKPVFSLQRVGVAHHRGDADSVINHCALDHVSMTYMRYGGWVSTNLVNNEFYVHGIPLTGQGGVHWNKRSFAVSQGAIGVIGGPSAQARLQYDAGYSHLVVRFSPEPLLRKLASAVGGGAERPIAFFDDPIRNVDDVLTQVRLTRFLAEELSRENVQISAILKTELEQAMMVGYLMGSRHNYSERLHKPDPAIAPWQVRRAAEFIEQSWNQPITIEALSSVTQSSAKTLFVQFKRSYGVSPMVFVRQVRLRRAQEALSRPEAGTTVTDVGLSCGFSNLGYFAKAYFDMFGERPSETLRRFKG